MKPSSVDQEKNLVTLNNGLKFKNYFDNQGIKRRKYLSNCLDCSAELWLQKSKLSKQTRCKSCSAKASLTEEKKQQISLTIRKKYQEDAEYKRRVNNARFIPKGDKHWNWKGGATPINQRTRTSEEANAWKLAVLHRDRLFL